MDYPAKILLFGEYGIILGSMALAIPYPRFSGQFCLPPPTDPLSKIAGESNMELKKLSSFFKSDAAKFKFINFERFEDEVNQGLYFNSTVPVGSGLGSSGALTAAIYVRYLIGSQPNEYYKIKSDLAAIETCFHGQSSGFDPLISLLKKPVLLESMNSMITDLDLSPFNKTYTLFLIDSLSKGNTRILVNNFIQKHRQSGFKEKIDHEYIPLVNQTIKSVIEADFDSFDRLISRYSKFQFSHFDAMIPPGMKTFFEYGINTGEFHLKICGSGGGGYVLGIASDRNKAEAYFNLNHLGYTVV